MTILIVEDNAAMRRLLDLAIDGTGTVIGYCCDGAEALEAYLRLRPAVVLMDIGTPRMDGLMATRQILSSDPTAKILIVSDYDDDLIRAAAAEAGACGCVPKEDLLRLAAMIRSLAGPETPV